MPYSDRTRFKIHPTVEAGTDRFLAGLVESTLSTLPRIRCLDKAAKDELVTRIVEAIQFHRLGLAPRRPKSSGAGLCKRIFVTNVEAALRRATLPSGNTRDGLLHRVIRALANDFKIDMPQDLIRLVRISRKSRPDEKRHFTTDIPPKSDLAEFSEADLLELRKQRVAYWTSRGRVPPICDQVGFL
jgi:hypothetical protein